MRGTTILVIFLSLVLASCVGDKNTNQKKSEPLVAKGDRVYGGYLRISETESYQSLNPSSIIDVTSNFIATQIYDGLVRLNNATLNIEPAIAEKWEVDPSGVKYTFHLRKGIFFQDDKCFSGGTGREVKALDFKYSFELLCKNTPENGAFSSTFKDRVKGANTYFEGKGELDGVKIIDDYTLEITLEHPSTIFLQILAEPSCGAVAKEAVDKYTKEIKIGTGAFIFDEAHSTKDKVVLRRNANYYGTDSLGNKLPFLDSVLIYIVPAKDKELALFKDGKLDMITSLPSQSIKEMVETQIQDFQDAPPKYLLDNAPEMITQYYTFNVSRPPFDNSKVRKAFNMAINRKKIVEEILNNQAFGPAIYGFTPPTFSGYDITKIKGYEYNVEDAKKLLAEAGYPNGRAFPPVKIILNSGGARYTNVVVEIQKQLRENLNINVDFEVIPRAKKLDLETAGQTDIARDAWVADYPSPESFLSVFFGESVPKDITLKSFPNTARYKNAKYDEYYKKGRDAINRDSSFVYFMKAEQILMNDAPMMVLWYDGNYRLTRYGIKNAYTNAMRYRNLSDVYIKEAKGKKPESKDSAK
ncbi:MAG: peptide ABC transporter substrate-binding protein [Bacteroidia bacterium]